MSDWTVRVVLDEDTSRAIRYLAGHLPITPPMTGIVKSAVREFIESHAENEIGERGAAFRGALAVLKRRPHLHVIGGQ